MRGTRVDCVDLIRCRGIIPAYAGNTCSSNGGTPIGQDHPRVCGEHDSAKDIAALDSGSSPRMRGTPHELRDGRVIDGIIPAYAGNTLPWISAARGGRDHPRVCGEHFRRVIVAFTLQGSSPRMRGTPPF